MTESEEENCGDREIMKRFKNKENDGVLQED